MFDKWKARFTAAKQNKNNKQNQDNNKTLIEDESDYIEQNDFEGQHVFTKEDVNNEAADDIENKKPYAKAQDDAISENLMDNLIKLRQEFGQSADLTIREFTVGKFKAAVITIEGMVNKLMVGENILKPLNQFNTDGLDINESFKFIRDNIFAATEQDQLSVMTEVMSLIMSGFAVLMFDGIPAAIAVGVQGFSFRGISEPLSESVLRGSREGFVEAVRINVSMIRRRIKSPKLRFESYFIGEQSKTNVYLCYMDGAVAPQVLKSIRDKLKTINMDSVIESGYIQPFFEQKPLSLFSTVGTTERPDTVCGKVMEGRVAVLVDGTPFALIIPHLFVENFQTIDDYTSRPYYATLIRILKYISFFASIFLPGIYVAIGTFHQEMLPDNLLYNIAKAEMNTPLTLLEEALLIHLVFEIVKEAGLRLPKPIGQAVSIVGGLVLGDTAVSSGFIGAPMVIIVALSAITGFVIPKLNEPIVAIRFISIIAGGYMGIFGVMVIMSMMWCNICAMNSNGIIYTTPVSPFGKTFWQDVAARIGWKSLGKRNLVIQKLPGSEISED